jgi:hypothetical protein
MTNYKQAEFDFKVKGEFPYTDEASYRRDLIKNEKRQRTLPSHLKHLSDEAIKSLRFVFKGRF